MQAKPGFLLLLFVQFFCILLSSCILLADLFCRFVEYLLYTMYSPNSRQSDMQMPFTSSMGSITYPLSHDTISSYNNYPGKSPSAGSVFEQPFYPSLFQSELPPFFISYRWWEDEATTVLWAFDIQEIKRVIRFRLLTDDNLPRTALQSRNSSTVDNFLLTLAELHERPFVANLSHLQKAEEILRRCRIARPMLFPWSWFPSQYTAQLNDAQAVAGMIDAESHLHFTQIPFEDWVRYSLGYPSSAVEWFLQQHTVFHAHLLNHLDEHPEEIERYVEVEKVGAGLTELQGQILCGSSSFVLTFFFFFHSSVIAPPKLQPLRPQGCSPMPIHSPSGIRRHAR